MTMPDEPISSRADDGRSAVGGDLVVPALALAFAAYFFSDIQGMGWEARINGTVIGTVLVALCVLQIARTSFLIATGTARAGLGGLVQPGRIMARRVALVAVLCLFVGFIRVTGTTLGLFLMMLSSMLVLGVRDWRWLALVSLGVSATVYLVFIVLLSARLPRGLLEWAIVRYLGIGG